MAKTIFFKTEKTIIFAQRHDREKAIELTDKIKNHTGLLTGITALINTNIAGVLGIATAASYLYEKHLTDLLYKYNFSIAIAKTRVLPRDIRMLCSEEETIWITKDIAFYFPESEYSLGAIADDVNHLLPPENAEQDFDARFWRD